MKSSAGVGSDTDTLPLDAGLEQRIHPLAQPHEIDLAAHAVFDGVLDVDQEIGVGRLGLDIDVQVTGSGWIAAREGAENTQFEDPQGVALRRFELAQGGEYLILGRVRARARCWALWSWGI